VAPSADKGDSRRDRAKMEARRLEAAQWFADGETQAGVARGFGVSRQTAHRWHEVWQGAGSAGLKAAGRAGRKPRLDRRQLTRVVAALARGPAPNGFPGNVWTAPRVATLIEQATGVHHHPTHVTRIFQRLGLPVHLAWWRRDTPETPLAFQRGMSVESRSFALP
jgi:transposase